MRMLKSSHCSNHCQWFWLLRSHNERVKNCHTQSPGSYSSICFATTKNYIEFMFYNTRTVCHAILPSATCQKGREDMSLMTGEGCLYRYPHSPRLAAVILTTAGRKNLYPTVKHPPLFNAKPELLCPSGSRMPRIFVILTTEGRKNLCLTAKHTPLFNAKSEILRPFRLRVTRSFVILTTAGRKNLYLTVKHPPLSTPTQRSTPPPIILSATAGRKNLYLIQIPPCNPVFNTLQ